MYITEKEKKIKIVELSNERLMVVANLDKKNGKEQHEEIQLILKLPKFEILDIQVNVFSLNEGRKEKLNINMSQLIGTKIKQEWKSKKFQQELKELKYINELFLEVINTLDEVYY
jgi:hypothetical protein